MADRVMKPRGGFKDSISIEVEDNDVVLTTTEEGEADVSFSFYVSVGVSLVLVLIIALLFYCLLSKRDLSPCPRRSDFGRRYSQVRHSLHSLHRRSRTWTVGSAR